MRGKSLQGEASDLWDEYPAVGPRLGVLLVLDAGGRAHLRTSNLVALARLQPSSLHLNGTEMDGTPAKIAFRVLSMFIKEYT